VATFLAMPIQRSNQRSKAWRSSPNGVELVDLCRYGEVETLYEGVITDNALSGQPNHWRVKS
jgi:hypothetical protein